MSKTFIFQRVFDFHIKNFARILPKNNIARYAHPS